MDHRLDTLAPEVTAADYTLAALGIENGPLLMRALTAGWLTPSEAERLRPLAEGVAFLIGQDVPTHRAHFPGES